MHIPQRPVARAAVGANVALNVRDCTPKSRAWRGALSWGMPVMFPGRCMAVVLARPSRALLHSTMRMPRVGAIATDHGPQPPRNWKCPRSTGGGGGGSTKSAETPILPIRPYCYVNLCWSSCCLDTPPPGNAKGATPCAEPDADNCRLSG